MCPKADLSLFLPRWRAGLIKRLRQAEQGEDRARARRMPARCWEAHVYLMSLSPEFLPVLKEGNTMQRVLFVIGMAPGQEHLWVSQNLCVWLQNDEVCTKMMFWDTALLAVLSPCAVVSGMAWGPVQSSLPGSRRILQGWNAWTCLFLHGSHSALCAEAWMLGFGG